LTTKFTQHTATSPPAFSLKLSAIGKTTLRLANSWRQPAHRAEKLAAPDKTVRPHPLGTPAGNNGTHKIYFAL
jgi:hypothetical protein